MSEIVFILGAGASVSAGAPVMTNFLDKAREIYSDGMIGNEKEDFERVFKSISDMQKLHSKSSLNIRNIEDIYSTVEMGRILGKLPGAKEEEIQTIAESLIKVINKTIEESIIFRLGSEVRNGIKAFEPNKEYLNLAKLIMKLNTERNINRSRCSIITFNYDIALDYAIQYLHLKINYGFMSTPNRSTYKDVALLKLHGSQNWALCPECNKIVVGNIELDTENASGYSKFRSEYCYFKHCNKIINRYPFIVPPTWNKSDKFINMKNVWHRAAIELSEAEIIIICGFSLSVTDQFFKYLFSVGTEGERIIKKILVYDPDPNVKQRVYELLGGGTHSQYKFENIYFDKALIDIPEKLGLEMKY